MLNDVIVCCDAVCVCVCVSDVHIGLELGRLIQQIRTQRKMSQKDLAAVSRYNCDLMHMRTYLPPTEDQ